MKYTLSLQEIREGDFFIKKFLTFVGKRSIM